MACRSLRRRLHRNWCGAQVTPIPVDRRLAVLAQPGTLIGISARGRDDRPMRERCSRMANRGRCRPHTYALKCMSPTIATVVNSVWLSGPGSACRFRALDGHRSVGVHGTDRSTIPRPKSSLPLQAAFGSGMFLCVAVGASWPGGCDSRLDGLRVPPWVPARTTNHAPPGTRYR
jgi:hypothetical protein